MYFLKYYLSNFEYVLIYTIVNNLMETVRGGKKSLSWFFISGRNYNENTLTFIHFLKDKNDPLQDDSHVNSL